MMKEGTCIFWFRETFVPRSQCKLFCFVMGKGSSKSAQVVRSKMHLQPILLLNMGIKQHNYIDYEM